MLLFNRGASPRMVEPCQDPPPSAIIPAAPVVPAEAGTHDSSTRHPRSCRNPDPGKSLGATLRPSPGNVPRKFRRPCVGRDSSTLPAIPAMTTAPFQPPLPSDNMEVMIILAGILAPAHPPQCDRMQLNATDNFSYPGFGRDKTGQTPDKTGHSTDKSGLQPAKTGQNPAAPTLKCPEMSAFVAV